MIHRVLTAGTSALAFMIAAPAFADDHPHQHVAGEIKDWLTDEAETTGAADANDTAEIATPTMSFGEWGVDPALIDNDIHPGDDFFAHVNAKWLAANPLPPQYSRFGAFNLLREKSTSDVKTLVDELVAAAPAAGTSERRIVDAYNAFYDTDAIDAAGLTPAYPYLTEIFGATSLEKLAVLWGKPGYSSPVGGFVTVDQKQPDTYTVYVFSGGLGLPDRSYYSDSSEKGREIQADYRAYLSFLFKEAGYADPDGTAVAVYAFEEKIASDIEWDRAVRRNRDLSYTAFTTDELVALAGDFPIATMLENTGLNASEKFVLTQVPPSAERAEELGLDAETLAKIGKGTPGMFALLANTDVATLQAWTTARFLSGNADVLPTRFDDANFAFYGRTLSGQPEQRERWKRAISEAESHLGEVLGKSYAERYFPAENKAAMDELVANLRLAMGQSITDIEWMSEATKAEARAKLDSFDPKIGYRDNLETYEGLTIVGDNPLANRMAAARWGMEDNVSKLGKPIDRTEWGMLPQTVNAYYNPSKNEIVFPAAILQQPFFGMSVDPAVNYGAIGGVIGHEIGHGFDDQGSKSDGTGKLRNWWQPEDLENFEARGDRLAAQYDAFCPLDDGETCLNGRLTLGENIGDVGGLSLAYRAYKLSLGGQEAPVIDGLTGDQRFFLAWAQVWRAQNREESMRQRIRVGPHSLEEFRVNGVVRQMDAWYEAFGVSEDHAMYIPPEERVRIW
ncbi:M13 family metallopeptidase [Pontixanthobacter sp.]|uniref:M13 family metallopeptidase n=1 Tax=Pontixanthobacter sp. TaxID=2792078 RepID=UPI003C7B1633